MSPCKHVHTTGRYVGRTCGSYALNEHPESGLCDRCFQEVRAEVAELMLAEYKQGFDRYEKLRKLNPTEYQELHITLGDEK